MKKLILHFDHNLTNSPVTAKIILEHQILINILRANVQDAGGVFLIEVPDEKCEEIRRAFEMEGVKVERGKIIEILTNVCINCGACKSLCAVDAIELDSDAKIRLTYERCIGCLNCVDACPVGAIVIPK